MQISKRKSAALLAAAAVVSGLLVSGGTAQAQSADDPKGTERVSRTRPVPHTDRPDHANAPVASKAAQDELSTLQARVRGYVAKHGAKYTFGTYLDATTGKIVIDTNAPADVVDSLTSTSTRGAAARETAAGTRVKVNRQRTTDLYHRRDDVPSYYGGGGLLASGALCSAGYTVTNSSGTRWMVSAGHCYAVGTRVNTESNLRYFGTVTNRALASLGQPGLDMELLSGSSYAGRIFTGGVTSSTSIPVVSAGSASTGYNNYCHSGRTTGENCGHTAVSTNAQVCTQTGCKSPVIAFNGGVLSQGGDSGSPFYAKDSRGAFIRGHVIAGNGSTSYAETWNKVASRYGVSIVTG